MRRTQHAVSTVLPSVGITKGLRKAAIRVSPSGKLVTSPRCTHDRYPFPWPRATDERRKRKIGTASTIAANPLNRIPSFMKKPRRESVSSLGCAITGLVDIFISPSAANNGAAYYSKRNKADRGSARDAMPTRQRHQ